MSLTIACSTIPLQSRKLDRPVRELGAAEWARELDEIKAGGFDAIDLVDSWLAPASLDRRELAELRSVLRDCDVAVAGLSIARRSVIDPVDGDANLEYAHRSLECAAALGAPVVNIGFHRPLLQEQTRTQFWMVPGAADDRTDETWRLAVERVREIAIHAATFDLGVSLELYEETLLDSSTDAVRLVTAVGQSNVGINPDLGNLVRVPAPLEKGWFDLLRDCLPHMSYWHVKNFIRLEHSRAGVFMSYPTELGVGVIDYREAFRLALGSGYAGPICVEYYDGDALGTAIRSREYIEAVLADLQPRMCVDAETAKTRRGARL
jgi:sugar phosphate isomerase/epimerase